jgi:SAM-dependent methyltransferase
MKQGIRAFAPRPLLELARRRRIALVRERNRQRSAREIFADIYRDNKWGGADGTFHSGSGSTTEHAERYASFVNHFARDHGVRRIVDLGCGDFTVGARLLESGAEYVGVDIVPELVERNERAYGSLHVSFRCLDIIADELPPGDLCLVRQVLQHLSNEQIESVLNNLRRYRYVLVTEHYPSPDVVLRPNVDKPCGEDVRIYDGSGVVLDAAPFCRRVEGPLLDVDAGHCLVRTGERIRTYLLENAGDSSRWEPA